MLFYTFIVRKVKRGKATDRMFTNEFPGGYVGNALILAKLKARELHGRLLPNVKGEPIAWHNTPDAPAPLSGDNRQGCTCSCCDHSEGSDCACDCHATGRCAFQKDTPSVCDGCGRVHSSDSCEL